VEVEGDRATHYVATERLTWLEQVESGRVPSAWRPSGPDTTGEALLLSPLDLVTRGSRQVFDFELLFEAYKPAEKRRWGYYTMPVMHGDQLVARLDPRLDRDTGTLEVRGLWLEDEALSRDEVFVDALAAGLVRLARFTGAKRVDLDAVGQARMRTRLRSGTSL
jgi:uncharacterized protein YcaQ